MNFSRHSQHELARSGLFRLDALLFAVAKDVLNGDFKFMPKIRDGFPVKADDAAQPKNAANKDVVALVVLEAGWIAFVIHGVHGCTLILSSNSRISST
jgi:hypothetical protein